MANVGIAGGRASSTPSCFLFDTSSTDFLLISDISDFYSTLILFSCFFTNSDFFFFSPVFFNIYIYIYIICIFLTNKSKRSELSESISALAGGIATWFSKLGPTGSMEESFGISS